MNLIDRVYGKTLFYIGSGIEFVLRILIAIMSFMTNIIDSLAKSLLAILGMGGCMFFFLMAGPFGLYVLFNPNVMATLLFLVLFPKIGKGLVFYLSYLKHMITEYLFDYSDSLTKGKSMKHKNFSAYGRDYINEWEEKRRKEQEERQRQQQKQWEEQFKQWQGFRGYQYSGGYGNYGGYGQNSGYGGGYGTASVSDFRNRYEKSCDVLGVSYTSDASQIKSSYRKKAKEYHPDINKSENATKMFQKINEAYEFLTEENISRYKQAA
jgi:DnaJ-domain-containing protein 1